METKACSKCGGEKELEGGFHSDKTARDGRKSYCKDCGNAMSRAWKAKNKERNDAYMKQWRAVNPRAEYCREWRALNPNRAAEYYAENREAILAYSAQWTRDHPEQRREMCANWKKANPEALRSYGSRRRARKRGLDGNGYTKKDVKILLFTQQGKCAYCLLGLDATYHVDHILSLARGGSNGADNICLACASCNLSKGSKLLHTEWTPPIQKHLLDAVMLLNFST